jgi:hypothetical protein
MLLDASLGKESLSINIENPFKADIDAMVKEIEAFTLRSNLSLKGVDLKGLIPKMIRGIAGCEDGCPSNAKSLVEKGFDNFEMKYIEGGILSAKTGVGEGKVLQIRMFPDF